MSSFNGLWVLPQAHFLYCLYFFINMCDETRETLIEKIEKAEKEAKGNNSVFDWFN